MSRLELEPEAVKLLREMARSSGVSCKEYVHALLHYAYSCHRRPGSWEAAQPFDYATYDQRLPERVADRWF
jgi:hypothetical protein